MAKVQNFSKDKFLSGLTAIIFHLFKKIKARGISGLSFPLPLPWN
jgi:hypothetical protein